MTTFLYPSTQVTIYRGMTPITTVKVAKLAIFIPKFLLLLLVYQHSYST